MVNCNSGNNDRLWENDLDDDDLRRVILQAETTHPEEFESESSSPPHTFTKFELMQLESICDGDYVPVVGINWYSTIRQDLCYREEDMCVRGQSPPMGDLQIAFNNEDVKYSLTQSPFVEQHFQAVMVEHDYLDKILGTIDWMQQRNFVLGIHDFTDWLRKRKYSSEDQRQEFEERKRYCLDRIDTYVKFTYYG